MKFPSRVSRVIGRPLPCFVPVAFSSVIRSGLIVPLCVMVMIAGFLGNQATAGPAAVKDLALAGDPGLPVTGAVGLDLRPRDTQGTRGWPPCGAGAPGTYLAGEFEQAFSIHCVAGDHALLFAAQPSAGIDSEPGVRVMRRLDGRPLQGLTPPPEGWEIPLTLYVVSFQRMGPLKTRGEILVSDVRIPPAVAIVAPQPARLYRYRYSYSPGHGFSSELLETAELPANTVPPGAGLPDGIFYVGSYTVMPSGHIVVSDTLAVRSGSPQG